MMNFHSYARDKTVAARNYSLRLDGGAALTFFSTNAGVVSDANTSVNRFGLNETIRLTWQPDHKVNVALESGHTVFYSYNFSTNSGKGKVLLDAIPVLFEFSMPLIKNITVRAGAGWYFLTTHLNYYGDVNSNYRSLGWIAGAAYSSRINDRLDLITEVKWMNATEHQLAVVSAGVLLAWKFYKW